jgi:hypothetical protein
VLHGMQKVSSMIIIVAANISESAERRYKAVRDDEMQ